MLSGYGYSILTALLVIKVNSWSTAIFFAPFVMSIISACGVNLGRSKFIFKAITALGILIFAFYHYELGVLGLMLIFAGMASNAICAAGNGFYMPASRLSNVPLSEMLNRGYIKMCSNTKLNILGDWIEVKDGFTSIGDILVLIGIWIAVLELFFP